MKKIFLLTIFACSALWAHAQVAFLLRTAEINDLPAENFNSVDQQPEKYAAIWFENTYSATGKAILTLDQVKSGALLSADQPAYKVLWVNIDAVGLANLADAGIDNDVINAIKAYVKAGGNVLLTKQATRLALDIERISLTQDLTWPTTTMESYNNSGTLAIQPLLGSNLSDEKKRDARQHPIYAGMENYDLVSGVGVNISGYNNDANYFWKELRRTDGTKSDNGDIANLNNFQSDWACSVLALQGNIGDFCLPVIIEFHPQGDYKGSVIAIGSAAYQWNTSNTNKGKVETLTSNALNYLAAGGNTYGYVMPYTLSELYSLSGDDGTYKPDYEAAKWFYDNYIVTNKGRFIHKEEAIPTGMKVLWVNNDRSAFTDRATFYNDLGGSTFKDTLEAFVKSGGNVFLTMQATRLANDIGRISVAPDYRMNGWQGRDEGARYMTADFYALKDANESRVGLDRHNHSVYKYLPNSAWVTHNEGGLDVYCKWQLMDFTDANRRTDNNAIWENHWDGYADAVHLARATKFEEDHHCVILGGYGHTTALDGVGFVEFYPYGDYNGTVIALGLHSYEWGTNNSLVGNVQNLTKGVLQYLFVVDPRVPGCDNCFYYISE